MVIIVSPPDGAKFFISPIPEMPTIRTKAEDPEPPPTVPDVWTAKLDSPDCVLNAGVDVQPIFDPDESIGGGFEITVPFGGNIRGGRLTLATRLPTSAPVSVDIEGTNPDQDDITNALPHNTLRAIACKESRLRQFAAP